MRRILQRPIFPLWFVFICLESVVSQGKPHLSSDQVLNIATKAARDTYPQDALRPEHPIFNLITKVWRVPFAVPPVVDDHQKRFIVYVYDATGHAEVTCPGLRFVADAFDKKELPAEVQPFVDEGQRVRELDCADLNGDGLPDFALVTEGQDQDPLTGRMLKILLRGPNGALTSVVTTSKVVQSPGEDGLTGMPTLFVRRNRIEVVNHSAGMHGFGDLDLYFEYSIPDGTWLLTRVENVIYGEHAEDENEYTRLPQDFGHVTLAQFDLKKFPH